MHCGLGSWSDLWLGRIGRNGVAYRFETNRDRFTMVNLLLVAVGGAFGSVLRFSIGNLVNFPFGTMTVNILGAVCAGSVYAIFVDHINHKAFLLLVPGFLGGFTTFSAFSLDVLKLWEQQNLNILFLYLFSTLTFSLLGVWLSYKITIWYLS